MKYPSLQTAHLRLCFAHWPEPLRAPGAIYTRPSCPTAPSNQPTVESDSRLDRPIERAVHFVSVPSQIGGFTGGRPALSSGSLRNFAPDALNRGHCSGRSALRNSPAIADAAMQRSFPESSGLPRPFVPFSPRFAARLRAKRIGGLTFASPATQPRHDRSCRESFPFGHDHRHSTPEPVHRPPTPGRRTQIASISGHQLPTERKDGFPADLLFLVPSSVFLASKPPHPLWLPTFRSDRRRDRRPGQRLLPLAGSKILAYQAQPDFEGVTFTHPGTLLHLEDPSIADQARCPEVMQESDFRRKITLRKKAPFFLMPFPRQARFGIDSFAIRLSCRLARGTPFI